MRGCPERQRKSRSCICSHGCAAIWHGVLCSRQKLAWSRLQKRTPTSPMQEAKQGAENLSTYEKAEGPHWPYSGKQMRPIPRVTVPSLYFSALCPLEGQGEWNISTCTHMTKTTLSLSLEGTGQFRPRQFAWDGGNYFEACGGLVRAEETSSLVLKQRKAMIEELHLLSKDRRRQVLPFSVSLRNPRKRGLGPSPIKHGCFIFCEALILVLLTTTTQRIYEWPSKGKADLA